MKRFPLMAAAAAFGLALAAGATQQLAAIGPKPMLPTGQRCYYHLWTCSYDSNAYWDGCDPGFTQGWVPTDVAQAICTTYHSS